MSDKPSDVTLDSPWEVRYIPLRYDTPSEKKFAIQKNDARRYTHMAVGPEEKNIVESLISLGSLWDWACTKLCTDRCMFRGCNVNEEAFLDDTMTGILKMIVQGMSKRFQQYNDRHTDSSPYLAAPVSQQYFEPAPYDEYDLTLVKFPLKGWQSRRNFRKARMSCGDDEREGTRYRYYGFRMVLGGLALDVGSIIKAVSDNSLDVEQPQRLNRRSPLRYRASVVADNLTS